jgi:hypothetical protein
MAQIGPDYTYNTDATIPAATNKKLIILARKNPIVAATVAKFLGIGDNVPGLNLSGSLDDLDTYTRNLIQTQFSQELALAKNEAAAEKAEQAQQSQPSGIAGVTAGVQNISSSITSGIQSGVSQVTGSIRGVSERFDNTLTSASRQINETMKPVSTQMGQILGTLTGVARDPLGSATQIPQTLLTLVEKVNPEFAARLEVTFKSEKMKNLANLPGQVMGSIQNLLTAADAILSLPLVLISDLYNGLLEIMQEISNLIDEAVSSIVKFIFGKDGLLDGFFPGLMVLIDAIGELASEIQGISTIFLGANPIAGFALNVQTYTNQLQGVLSNPTNLIVSYLPPQVSQGLYIIRNPQQLVNNIIPPELTQQFAKLSQITGFGFNGNMGYGFEAVLEGLQGGVVSSILSKFANQYGILAPLVGLTQPPSDKQALQLGFPPQLTPAIAGGQPASQGIVQPQRVPKKVLPTKQDTQGPNTQTIASPSTSTQPSRTGIGATNAPTPVTLPTPQINSLFDLQT